MRYASRFARVRPRTLACADKVAIIATGGLPNRAQIGSTQGMYNLSDAVELFSVSSHGVKLPLSYSMGIWS